MDRICDNVAYVIGRIKELWGEKPGKKALQKVVFLIQQKGVDLGYDYGLHFYGPYSAALDERTRFLSADGVVLFRYAGYHHLIGLNTDKYVVEPEELSSGELALVDEVIRRFQGRSASELELLTTAIYVYDHLVDRSKSEIIAGVQKIKGTKYSEEEIEAALDEFPYFGKHI